MLIVLLNDRLKLPEYNPFRATQSDNSRAQAEIVRLNQEAQITEEAIMYTEKTLQNMQSSFPIHI